MAQSRASTVQQRRDEVYEALQYSTQQAFSVWRRNSTAVKNSSRRQTRSGTLWREKWKRKNIEWCGAQLEANSVARGAEGAVKR